MALRHPDAGHRTIGFGGPTALSPLEVVALFKGVAVRPFCIERIPEEALRAQFEHGTDSLQKSFAALMLGYVSGDAIDTTGVQMRGFHIKIPFLIYWLSSRCCHGFFRFP